MKNFRSVFGIATLMFVFAILANAQASRTWISGVGDDVNPCSRTAPCKTFAGAISKTAAGGEINCLDPGGFGAVTITKSITIDCGFTGGILSAGTNGIVVNDSSGNAIVNIRNLVIDGAGVTPGVNAINFIAGKKVQVDNVRMWGFTNSCINVSASATVVLNVYNSTMTDCGLTGIKASTTSGGVQGDFQNIRIWNPGTSGIDAGANTRIVVKDSDISFATNGVTQGNATSGNGSLVLLVNCNVSVNQNAVVGGPASVLTVQKCAFFLNQLVFGGGTINSTGDNVIFGNVLTGAPPTAATVI